MDRNRMMVPRSQLTNCRSQQVLGIQQIESRNSRQAFLADNFLRNTQHEPLNNDERVQHPQATQQIPLPLNQFVAEVTIKYESLLDSIVTPFDTITRLCLFDNHLPGIPKKISDELEVQQETHLEKLELVISLLKALSSAHVLLFERLLRRLDA